MDFNEEMNSVKNAKTGASYIDTSGIMLVSLKGYKLVTPDKGTPYLEVTFETVVPEGDTPQVNTTRLYRVKDGDSPESAEWKLKRIKELLMNAGANFDLQGEEVIKSAIGKQVQALFKEVEYIGYDKNNMNKPGIRTKIEYSFSAKVDATINGNQSYLYSKLSEKDAKKLEGELVTWNRDNPSSTSQSETPAQAPVQSSESAEPKEDDDLPF